MMNQFDVNQYWRDVLRQNAGALPSYFTEDARVYWHNTAECFTVEEFVLANCTYPGDWTGEIEKLLKLDDLMITVTHVWDRELSFHVTSFIHLSGDKIDRIDEYWGDDGEPPKWRQELHIGKK